MDSGILREISEKNHIAMEQLYNQYERVTYQIAYHIVGDALLAEQVVLNLFSSIWNSTGIVPQNGNLSVQMLKATRQLAERLMAESK